jgi:hypothetical protein
MPRKRARPVREGVVGKGAPTRSHLAGDLLHVTYGSERAGGGSSLPLLARRDGGIRSQRRQ